VTAAPAGVVVDGARLLAPGGLQANRGGPGDSSGIAMAATFTGVLFDPLALQPGQVRLLDIAVGLGHQARFNGQTAYFYSAAEHSLIMAREAGLRWGPEAARIALMHDAPEAWLGDMIRPLKASMPTFRAAEAAAWRAIAEALKLPEAIPPQIHALDDEMLATERAALLPNAPAFPGLPAPCPRLGHFIRGMAPAEARVAFLARAREMFEGSAFPEETPCPQRFAGEAREGAA